jgi:ankyrin repeat protein
MAWTPACLLAVSCCAVRAGYLQDVNAGDAEQRTPLHYACGFNHLEIAKMLIDEGAKLEVLDSKGNTPLHYAAGYGRPQLVRAPYVGVETV